MLCRVCLWGGVASGLMVTSSPYVSRKLTGVSEEAPPHHERLPDDMGWVWFPGRQEGRAVSGPAHTDEQPGGGLPSGQRSASHHLPSPGGEVQPDGQQD